MSCVIGEPSALRESIRTKTPRCSIARNDLFDADRRDVELGQVDAQVRVALIGAYDDAARLRDRKIGAGHAGIGLEEIGPRVLALALGQVVDVAVFRVGTDVLGEDPRHVSSELVDRGHDDVARRLVVELLDALAEIRLHDLDPPILEEGPHFALVGEHRLGLDQRARAARAHDVEHDLVVLGSVLRPVHVRAVPGRVALELLEIVREVGQRVLLDRRRQRPQLLPLRNAARSPGRASCAGPKPLVVEVEMVLGLDELRGPAWSMRFMALALMQWLRTRCGTSGSAPRSPGSVQDLRDMDELHRQARAARRSPSDA